MSEETPLPAEDIPADVEVDAAADTSRDTTVDTAASQQRAARRRLAIIVGVIAVAAVLVVGALLTADGGDDDASNGDSSPAVASDSNDSATGTQTPGGNTGVPGQVPPGSLTPTAPLSPTERGIATTPARQGSELATITTPPDRTLAMIDSDKLDASSSFVVEFRPYGYGPPREGETLVILVDKVLSSTEKADGSVDLTGRNMLVTLIPTGSDSVEVGGRYRGEIVFRARGDLLAPFLGGVKAIQ